MTAKILIYASSSPSTAQKYLSLSSSLTRSLHSRNFSIINGGGSLGNMGAVNRTAKEIGCEVDVVIHEMWVDGEFWREGGGECVVVGGKDLNERKRCLLKNASGIIVLPGGLGTLEEALEVLSLKSCNLLRDIPVAFLSGGEGKGGEAFWQPIKEMLKRIEADGMLREGVKISKGDGGEDGEDGDAVCEFFNEPDECTAWIERAIKRRESESGGDGDGGGGI